MNETRECKSLREEWGHLPAADLPDAPRDHVRACAACAAFFSGQERLVALLRLKRFETPDPAFEGRLVHRVRTRLENVASLEPERARVAQPPEARRWSWLAPLAAAAGLTVAVAIHLHEPSVSGGPETVAANSPVDTPVPSAVVQTQDRHLRDLFRVEPTSSDRIDELVRVARENGIAVVDATHTATNSNRSLTGGELLPVAAPRP